jgi:hypothetical protein
MFTLVGCRGIAPASDTSVEILNVESVRDVLYVKCLLKNNSDKKSYFPIDSCSVKFLNWIDKKTTVNSFYVLFYQKKDTIYSSFRDVYYKDPLIYFKRKDSLNKVNTKIIDSLGEKKQGLFWGIRYREIQKNSFYINPKSSKIIFLKINLHNTIRKEVTVYDTSYYDKEKLKNSHIQIVIKIDSKETENLLLQKDLNYLHRHNIKIFNGTICSNKVPLEIK